MISCLKTTNEVPYPLCPSVKPLCPSVKPDCNRNSELRCTFYPQTPQGGGLNQKQIYVEIVNLSAK